MKYKNIILIIVSIILFLYAILIGIVPSVMTKCFDKEEFQERLTDALGLDATIGTYTVRVQPNLQTIITITELDVKFPDEQPVFKAKLAELTTTFSSLFSNKYVIKKLDLKFVKYDDLILPDGINKIAFLPARITPKPFRKNSITIVSGPVYVKDIDVSYTQTSPYSYKKESYRQLTYTKEQVRSFLASQNFSNIKIK